MPSADLLLYFQSDLIVQEQWWVNGMHYAQTCEVIHTIQGSGQLKNTQANIRKNWLSNLGANKKDVWPHLEDTYGKSNTAMWFRRWQIFYMACAELFAYEGGDVWGVSHYLFQKAPERFSRQT